MVEVIADRFADALHAVDGDKGATHLPSQLGAESVTNSAMIVRSFTNLGKWMPQLIEWGLRTLLLTSFLVKF